MLTPSRTAQNNEKRFELGDPDTNPHCITGSTSRDVDKGFQTFNKSPSHFGSSEQSVNSQSQHLSTDEDSQPEICGAVSLRGSDRSSPTRASVLMLSRRDYGKPNHLDLNFRGPQNRRSTGSNNSRPASALEAPHDAKQTLLRGMPSTEENGRECSVLPRENPGCWTLGDTDCSIESRLGNLRVSRDAVLNFSQHGPSRAPWQIVEPELVQADPQLLPSDPLNTGNGHGNDESSTSSSPLSTPGLQVIGFHDGLSSNSSTTSTDLSEHSDSEDIPSKNEPSPASVALDALMMESTTCLIFGWLYSRIVLNLPSIAENVRKCPEGPGSGQSSRGTGNRSLMGSPRQANNSSTRGESNGEDGRDGDDQSGQPEQNSQNINDPPPNLLRPLACPYNKYDPKRYSAFNEAEKEYRTCSSGYWPDISRLK